MTRQIKKELIRLEDGREAILSAAQIGANKYEVMLHRDGLEMEEFHTAQCSTERTAMSIFQEMKEQYHTPVLTGRYQKLADDLKAALQYGLEHAGEDDGGTCNFDSPTLYLPRWKRQLVETAAKAAGLGCFVWKAFSKNAYVFSVPGVGQGYTRTNAAEAMSQFLGGLGYDAGMYYQMD